MKRSVLSLEVQDILRLLDVMRVAVVLLAGQAIRRREKGRRKGVRSR